MAYVDRFPTTKKQNKNTGLVFQVSLLLSLDQVLGWCGGDPVSCALAPASLGLWQEAICRHSKVYVGQQDSMWLTQFKEGI